MAVTPLPVASVAMGPEQQAGYRPHQGSLWGP